MTASGRTQSSLDDVIALELQAHTPQCRADPRRIRELLAEDFLGIGASGRGWDLASTLEMLRPESQDPDTSEIEVADVRARQIAPGCATADGAWCSIKEPQSPSRRSSDPGTQPQRRRRRGARRPASSRGSQLLWLVGMWVDGQPVTVSPPTWVAVNE